MRRSIDDDEPVEKPSTAHDVAVKAFLKGHGLDVSVMPAATLASISAELAKPEHATQSAEEVFAELIKEDEDTGMYVTTDGEFLGYADLAKGDVVDILTKLGERLAWQNARLAGLAAERQSYIDRIVAGYDARIARVQRSIVWSKEIYTPLAKRHIETVNQGLDEKKQLKSLKLGLLTIKLVKTKDKVDIENEKEAVAELRRLYLDPEGPFYEPETARKIQRHLERIDELLEEQAIPVEKWINKKETVFKSAIPSEMKEALALENLAWVPGGDVVCEIE